MQHTTAKHVNFNVFVMSFERQSYNYDLSLHLNSMSLSTSQTIYLDIAPKPAWVHSCNVQLKVNALPLFHQR